MPTIASFTETSVTHDQLRRVLADHLALEHVRLFRRLLVKRCGVIATVVAVLGMSAPLLPAVGTWAIVGMFVAAPVAAWIRELALEARVAHGLAATEAGCIEVRPRSSRSLIRK